MAGLSQSALAHEVGINPSSLSRLETGELRDVTVTRLSEMASALGCEISLNLHPIGDPLRDKGQLAAGRRFEAVLATIWRVTDETLLPGEGEQRAWDKLLRLVGATRHYLVGVDIETRIRDVQALTRRTRGRERDGEVDAIVIVLSDSATNRRLVGDLREALGDEYKSSPREILAALRAGARLPGSGVFLI